METNAAAFRLLMDYAEDETNRRRIIDEIAGHFRTAQKHGVFRRMNTPIAAAAYGLVEGVMKQWLADPAPRTSTYVRELGAALEGMVVKL